MTREEMMQTLQEKFLPEIASSTAVALADIAGTNNVGVIIIAHIEGQGVITSTIPLEDALTMMASSAEMIVAEHAPSKGPVQ